MRKVTTHQAKTQLSQLLGSVERGESILILRRDKVVAKLVRANGHTAEKARPKVGKHTSALVTASDDAFAPLEGQELDVWGLG